MKRVLMGVYRRAYRHFGDQILKLKYPQLKDAFRIQSHLTHLERTKLYELAHSAATIVEIGSYTGASACCFGVAAQENGFGKILCIDTWKNDAMSEGGRDTLVEFKANTKAYIDQISLIRGFSGAVVGDVCNQVSHIDVLFIDGDHSYEGVKADWLSYGPLLRTGSIVIFHDYGWAEGVKRVVNEEVVQYVESEVKLPNMWWGRITTEL